MQRISYLLDNKLKTTRRKQTGQLVENKTEIETVEKLNTGRRTDVKLTIAEFSGDVFSILGSKLFQNLLQMQIKPRDNSVKKFS